MTPLDCSTRHLRRTLSTGRCGPGPNGADAIQGRATRATNVGHAWVWRSLGAELARRGRDLVTVPRRGLPGQPQRVAVIARDHVQVEVEDGLPGLRPAGIEQVHAHRPES